MQPSTHINEVFSICPNELLGKGSTGFHNSQPHHRVAIKQIDLSTINNEVTQYLLSCQIAALSNLGKLENTGHENIVKLIDIVMNQNTMYLVLELLEGGTLAQHIKKHPQGLPVDQAMHIFRQILEGYQRIKSKQIIHRDLKPDNILFKRQDSKTIAIIDFGYCTMEEVPNKPQVFYNVGSPKYMSPEAYKDNKYSEKSDIWAMGVMLYQMLVGHTCDKGLSMEAYLDMLQKKGVPFPPSISGFQHFLLSNMLNYNHFHRFDCEHILNEVRKNISGELHRIHGNDNYQIQQSPAPRQQSPMHNQQIQLSPQQNPQSFKVQEVKINQGSPGDVVGRQNSLLNLRNTLNHSDLLALRANRHQPLFHSLMMPQDHPLFRVERNSIPERGLRSDSKIHDQNQHPQGSNNVRVISFHMQADKNRQQQPGSILGRVQNVDLDSVRQIVHRRNPDFMQQSKINHPGQATVKHLTVTPIHPQDLRQQLLSTQSQYINGKKPMNLNELPQLLQIQQIKPQKISNEVRSAHLLMAPTPKNQHSNVPQSIEYENRQFFTNNFTPKAGQSPPEVLQMSVIHPHIPQGQHQQPQGSPSPSGFHSRGFQQGSQGLSFKKNPSSGQLVINLNRDHQAPRQPQNYSNRFPETRARIINQDLTATRIPQSQRLSRNDQERSINPQVRSNPSNAQQDNMRRIIHSRPQTQASRNLMQAMSNPARVMPLHIQPQPLFLRQAMQAIIK